MSVFNILEDSWIDVLETEDNVTTISLRDLLAQAHKIARLSEPSPLTEIALLRFLIALVSDGLREQIPTESDWAPFVEQCANGLPPDAIEAILAPLVGRSDVLDPEHEAFFDGPAIRRVRGWDDPKARQPISRFLPELPSGTNLAHFSHTSDDELALCIGCLLKSRAVDAAFARGGLGPSLSRNLLATVGGTEPRYVVPVGGSLLETILLNIAVGDRSRPSWISVHSSKDGEPGPIARMTWRPRLVMPVDSSETDLPCGRCATTERPRFTQAVMVDTYNHAGSPFGSKSDIERWKTAATDPHLLPFEKGTITLGVNPEEWSPRAITRMLPGVNERQSDRLSRWCHTASHGTLAITVTSSAGNQAKIDDAPHSVIQIPKGLLERSTEDRAAIAKALTTIFVDRSHGEARQKLIPQAVPRLLSEIAVAEAPFETIATWLASAKTLVHIDDETERPLHEAAKRLIQRLEKLSPRELAALRPLGQGGSPDLAARQAAFEAVWHQGGLPSGSRRHALREALAAVAPIYAVYSKSHRYYNKPRSFEARLHGALRSEFRLGDGPIGKLLAQIVHASPPARNDLLHRLIGAVIDSEPNRRGRIDFADLLLDVACWNDPINPTPARWKQLLKRTERVSA